MACHHQLKHQVKDLLQALRCLWEHINLYPTVTIFRNGCRIPFVPTISNCFYKTEPNLPLAAPAAVPPARNGERGPEKTNSHQQESILWSGPWGVSLFGMHDATRTILDDIDLIDIWHFFIEHDSSMIYFDLKTLQLAVDTDVTSQHISCTSICPSLLRGSLPRQLRVKVRDHIVHNSTALHLHSRLERQETCNSWKTRKHAPPSAISAKCLLENEWNDVQKTVRRTVCRDTVRETQKLAYAWNLHQGRIFGDIKVDVPPPLKTAHRSPSSTLCIKDVSMEGSSSITSSFEG